MLSPGTEGAGLARAGDAGWAGSAVGAGPREDCLPATSGSSGVRTLPAIPSLGASAAGAAEGRAGPGCCSGKLGAVRAVPGLLRPVPRSTAAPQSWCPALKLPVGLGWVAAAARGDPSSSFPSHAPFPACVRPSEEMVKMVLSRPCLPGDQFTTSILRHWCIKHDDLLAEHIKSLLIKNNSLPRKRQR